MSSLPSAFSANLSLNQAGVNVWYPDHWAVQNGGAKGFIVADPREEVVCVFSVEAKRSIQEALQAMDEGIGQWVQDVQPVGSPQQTTLNGMPAYYIDGKGRVQRSPVDLSLLVVETPGNQFLMIYLLVESARAQAHASTIQQILAGIQPQGGSFSGGNPGGNNGRLIYRVVPPENNQFALYQRVFEEGQLDQIADVLNTFIGLPRDVPVVAQECGEINAVYLHEQHAVVLCYELAAFFHQSFLNLNQQPAEALENTMHALIFSMLHELGHAYIGELEMGITGGEEDAVDDFAAVVLISAEQARIARNGALALLMLGEAGGEMPFWDEHSFGQQRFFNVLCIAFGADPVNNAHLVPEVIPQARAVRCPDEFKKKYKAWDTMLTPFQR